MTNKVKAVTRKRKIDQPAFKFGLGDEVVDKVTGYRGEITAQTQWLYGCRRYSVQMKKLNKDGKAPESMGFDEMALVLVKEAGTGAKIVQTGGPQREPSRPSNAKR